MRVIPGLSAVSGGVGTLATKGEIRVPGRAGSADGVFGVVVGRKIDISRPDARAAVAVAKARNTGKSSSSKNKLRHLPEQPENTSVPLF